jgi:sugar phosphate isomerase/epimerase
MRFSLNTVIFRDRNIEDALPIIKRLNYDGVEIAWIPREHPFYTGKDIDVPRLRSACRGLDLPVAALCPFYPPEYNLAHTSVQKRKRAVDNVKHMIEASAELGSGIVVVLPSACSAEPTGDFGVEWRNAVDSLKEIGLYSQGYGVVLAIEPIARFLTHTVTRVDQALMLVKEAQTPSLGVMADSFHMNIEERTIEEALRRANGSLVHVHVSDSNNFAPGSGHLDFRKIFDVLDEIRYNGFVSAELAESPSEAEQSAAATIDFLRHLRG